MVMAIVAVTPKDRTLLQKIGVKDSKLLTPAKRNKLARMIKQHCPHVIIKVSPEKIDKSLKKEGDSLNLLEARTSTQLINRLLKKVKQLSEVMLDLPAKNKQEYLDAVTKELHTKVKVEAEFKADQNHVAVAAASILAKTSRDSAMRSFEKTLGIPLGSGYPADPITKNCLEKHFNAVCEAKIIRRSWKTAQRQEQTKLDTFS